MTSPNQVGIVGGGGVMGHGIALAFLQKSSAGVCLISHRRESLEHGRELILDGSYGLRAACRRGLMTEEQVEEAQARLSVTTDLAQGVRTADLVIESVPELLNLKREVVRQIESHAGATAVIATNTSSFPISDVNAFMVAPQRLIGTHWFYPANVMSLVEMGRPDAVDRDTFETMRQWLASIGKNPIPVGDSPGFVMTRFVNNYLAEAIRIVEAGIADPSQVDKMCRIGLGWPVGPFEFLDDMAGFEAFYRAQTYLEQELGDRYAVPELASNLFGAGYLGSPALKTSSAGGWYDFFKVPRDNS